MISEKTLYGSLVSTSLLINDTSNRFFQRYHLGNTRYYALVSIRQAPGISLSDLSEKLLCTKGNTTRIIRSLEEDGLLEREINERDNRALRLTLTPKGETLLEEASAAYQAFNQRRFACLNDTEQETLQRHLDTLNRHLEDLLQDLIVDI